jgi:type II secretion system protein C
MTLTQNYPQLKKLPQWLTALLVVLLGITLAKLLWLFLTPEEKMPTPLASVPQGELAKPKKQPNYGEIIKRQHLFGVVKKKKTVVVKNQPTKVEPTIPTVVIPKITVKLFGIMSYSSQTSGYALLSFNNQPQKVYSLGENLDDKAKKGDEKKIFISEIKTEKVVVNNHGTFEEFILPRTFKGTDQTVLKTNALVLGPSSAKPAPTVQPTQPPRAVTPPRNTPPVSNPAVAESVPKKEDFSVKDLSTFREKMMADPTKLMEIANARPYIREGKVIGFKVRAGKRRDIFRKLGLRNGDIVKEVNGIQLDSNEKGMMLVGELAGASEVSVTVLRGKREVQLPTLHF